MFGLILVLFSNYTSFAQKKASTFFLKLYTYAITYIKTHVVKCKRRNFHGMDPDCFISMYTLKFRMQITIILELFLYLLYSVPFNKIYICETGLGDLHFLGETPLPDCKMTMKSGVTQLDFSPSPKLDVNIKVALSLSINIYSVVS